MDEKERKKLLIDFSGVHRNFDKNLLVHRLFEKVVARSPNSVALKFRENILTYDELNRKANRLANHLVDLGAAPDERIAVCMERGIEMVVALLAVLKAGAAYVPLDPSYPQQRLNYMLEDCKAKILVKRGALRQSVRANVEVDLDKDIAALNASSQCNSENDLSGLNSGCLAYVMYTSGSTGRPKGVMNQHDGLVNRLLWAEDAFNVTSSDRVLQKTPFGFDVSVWEIFLPLIVGATLVIAEPGGHQDPFYLARLMDEERITLIHFVPSMLQIYLECLNDRRHRSLRHVLCSGEALTRSLENRFRRELPDLELHNLYGPTEAAIDVTHWRCRESLSDSNPPIGRPIANTKIYILDEQRQLVPIGVVGEIYISGVQVARGYFGRDDLTKERFLADPFDQGGSAARMYRTGDLGTYQADGTILYCGRNDFQVKLRGYRIELSEIEKALTDLPGVRQAVVVARENNDGDKILVAYVQMSVDSTPTELAAASMKHALAESLPLYMIPPHIVRQDSFPLTTNGKLDREALPLPAGLRPVSKG